MPRISQLQSLTSADNADEIAIVDVSASTTKKITRGDLLKAPLPANSVTTAAVTDGAVTPEKRSGGFKIGFIPGSTFGTTGIKTITGVGFKPKLVKFYLQYDSTSAARMSTGAMTETDQHLETFVTSGSTATSTFSNTRCIGYINTGSTAYSMSAAFSSMDSDGFKINVTNASSTLGVAYEAYA